MKLIAYALLMSAAILVSACSPSFYYKPNPATTYDNNTFISSGFTFAISQKANSRVVLTAYKPSGGPLELTIGYLNINLDRADAIPEDIQVVADDGTQTRPLQVYSADQYLTKLHRRQNAAMMVKAFSDGYNNASAGYSTSTTYGTSVSSNGTLQTGSTTTTTYDANKVNEANARSNHELNQMAVNYKQYNQSVNQGLLRDNTLFRGQQVEGTVVVNTGTGFSDMIYVTVPFAGEQHNFTLLPNR